MSRAREMLSPYSNRYIYVSQAKIYFLFTFAFGKNFKRNETLLDGDDDDDNTQ